MRKKGGAFWSTFFIFLEIFKCRQETNRNCGWELELKRGASALLLTLQSLSLSVSLSL